VLVGYLRYAGEHRTERGRKRSYKLPCAKPEDGSLDPWARQSSWVFQILDSKIRSLKIDKNRFKSA
jgi:hypothetical protein